MSIDQGFIGHSPEPSAPMNVAVMSLRDWFAGQALAGIASWANYEADIPAEDAAEDAYIYADAMLAAREKKK